MRICTASTRSRSPPTGRSSGAHFSRWLTRIKIRHAERLLRVKGIVSIAGEDAKIAIHGVHHVFHPPERLPRLAASEGESRIVFITRGDVRREIESAWLSVQVEPHPYRMTA